MLRISVFFFDSDDKAKEEWLSYLVNLLEKAKVGTVCCGLDSIIKMLKG